MTVYFILRLNPITIKRVSKPADSSNPTNWVRFRSKCTAEKASSFTSPRGKHLELHWSMFTFNHHQHTIHFLRLQLDLFLPRINPVLVALKTFMKTNISNIDTYSKYYRDEFELEFSGSSEPELWMCRAESSRAGALQFSSWNRAEFFLRTTIKFPKFYQYHDYNQLHDNLYEFI